MGEIRHSVLAVILATLLLAAFIGFNAVRGSRARAAVTDPLKGSEREQLPVSYEGRAKQMVFHDFEGGNPADTASHLAPSGHTGRQSLKMSTRVPFSPGLWVPFKDLTPGDSSWIRATGYVWFNCHPSEVECSLVATCNQRGVNYKYLFVALEHEGLKAFTWNRVSIDYRIPAAAGGDDVLQAYFWYRGSGEMLVDDIGIEYYE